MCFPCICLLHDTNALKAAFLKAFHFILLVAGNLVDPGIEAFSNGTFILALFGYTAPAAELKGRICNQQVETLAIHLFLAPCSMLKSHLCVARYPSGKQTQGRKWTWTASPCQLGFAVI